MSSELPIETSRYSTLAWRVFRGPFRELSRKSFGFGRDRLCIAVGTIWQ
jgi:hypothetical protein